MASGVSHTPRTACYRCIFPLTTPSYVSVNEEADNARPRNSQMSKAATIITDGHDTKSVLTMLSESVEMICSQASSADYSGGGACDMQGVVGPAPGIIGVMQALEVLKICLGLTEGVLHGKLLLFDGLSRGAPWRCVTLRKKKDDCLVCGGCPVITTLKAELYERFCPAVASCVRLPPALSISPLSFAHLCLAQRGSILHDSSIGQDSKSMWKDSDKSMGNSGDKNGVRNLCADLLCNGDLSVRVIMASASARPPAISGSHLSFAASRYNLSVSTTSDTRVVVAVVVDVRPAIHYSIGHLTGTENWPMDVLLRDVLKLQHILARLQCFRNTRPLFEPLHSNDKKTIQSICDELFQKLGLSNCGISVTSWYGCLGLLPPYGDVSRMDPHDSSQHEKVSPATKSHAEQNARCSFRILMTCRRGNDSSTATTLLNGLFAQLQMVCKPVAFYKAHAQKDFFVAGYTPGSKDVVEDETMSRQSKTLQQLADRIHRVTLTGCSVIGSDAAGEMEHGRDARRVEQPWLLGNVVAINLTGGLMKLRHAVHHFRKLPLV
eukprot:GHVS01045043.1.p1 GENE.GHVS01045043.1~~GHVS01045043.1.p1  ORF type:complete len:560 (+),score=23.00 GHVS01045043.1:31-1680(+)